MILRRSLLGAALALPMTRLARGQTAHRLTILYMNDFHARHEPVDAAYATCAPAGGRAGCFGGSPRLATALARGRAAAEAAGRRVLLLDAGDQFQGSLFYTAWKGEVELKVMHVLGTEAMAVGNHEFDDGPANLARFVRGARFPVLSANIDAAADPDLRGLLKPWVMFDKGGLKVAVVGLTTPDTPIMSSPGRTIRFGEPQEALARAAVEARAAGAQVVVALSHLGVSVDQRIAGTVPGVDAIVGGHSHTLLSDTEPGAAGPAHQVFDRGAARTAVVQAACYSRFHGRLDLDVAANGEVLAVGGDCLHVGIDLPEEPEVASIVSGYAAQLAQVRAQPVGRTTAAFGTEACRLAECAMGDLLAGAMLSHVPEADVAIANAGGIRAGLPEGTVTRGDILTMLPFSNTLAVVKLTGADLQAAVAHGLSRAGQGGFPQVAGMRIVWDPFAAPAARLRSLEVAGRPVEPDRLYVVVTNDFLRGGGDGYAVLRDRAIAPYDGGLPLEDVLSATLAARSPVTPSMDGRISLGGR